VGLGSK
jgi:hypothetical protein